MIALAIALGALLLAVIFYACRRARPIDDIYATLTRSGHERANSSATTDQRSGFCKHGSAARLLLPFVRRNNSRHSQRDMHRGEGAHAHHPSELARTSGHDCTTTGDVRVACSASRLSNSDTLSREPETQRSAESPSPEDDDIVIASGSAASSAIPAAAATGVENEHGESHSQGERRTHSSGAHSATVRRTDNSAASDQPADMLRAAIAEMCVDDNTLELHDLLARGGFGAVYRGTWRNMEVRFSLSAACCSLKRLQQVEAAALVA